MTRLCENDHEVGDGLYYCPTCGSVDVAEAGPDGHRVRPSGAPRALRDPMRSGTAARAAETARARATARIGQLAVWGGGLWLLGLVVVVASADLADDPSFGIAAGAVVGALGSALASVAVVGWGVKLGREASAR
jgi:hypothetical protein